MKRLIPTIVAVTITAAGFSSYAQEEKNVKLFCDQTSKITEALQNKFKERLAIVGRTDSMATTIWVNPENNTWTILASFEDGKSCVLATGKDLTPVPQPEQQQKAPKDLRSAKQLVS
jgi:hypothetical protein